MVKWHSENKSIKRFYMLLHKTNNFQIAFVAISKIITDASVVMSATIYFCVKQSSITPICFVGVQFFIMLFVLVCVE